MPLVSARGPLRPLHPLHAILLAFPLPLFLGALLSDFAYRSTFHIQWANFSSWLIAGGLLVGGFALFWSLINLFRRGPARKGRLVVYFVVLLAMWGLGFVNALVHAKDVDGTILNRLRKGQTTYREAVRDGLYCDFGEGVVDWDGIARGLDQAGFAGWVVAEQDRELQQDDPRPAASLRHNRGFMRDLFNV